MATYFLIDAQNNIVSTVEWDGVAPFVAEDGFTHGGWAPPAGLTAVLGDGMWRDGWKWDGTKAYDPNPPPAIEAPTVTVEAPTLGPGINKV